MYAIRSYYVHIKKQRARNRIFSVSDGIKGRLDTVDIGSLDLVHVLIQKAEAENADRIRIGFQLLNDQVVVFAGFNVSTVFADGMTDLV